MTGKPPPPPINLKGRYETRLKNVLIRLNRTLCPGDRGAVAEFLTCVNPKIAEKADAHTWMPPIHIAALERRPDNRAAFFALIYRTIEAYWLLCRLDESAHLEDLVLKLERVAGRPGFNPWTQFRLTVDERTGICSLEIPG